MCSINWICKHNKAFQANPVLAWNIYRRPVNDLGKSSESSFSNIQPENVQVTLRSTLHSFELKRFVFVGHNIDFLSSKISCPPHKVVS